MFGLPASEIIAIAAVCVAIFAAIFTGYQALLLRKHNRLSVKPHIAQTHEIYESKKFDNCLEAIFESRNDGIGPAVIRKYAVFFENKKIASSVDSVNRSAIAASVMKKINVLNTKVIDFGAEGTIKDIQNSVNVFAEGSYFPVNDNKIILQITFENNPRLNSMFGEFIRRLTILFVYEDIYGTKFKNFEKLKKRWWERWPLNMGSDKIPDTADNLRIV